jgi:WXXGXW repeat (2 copies)
MIERKEVHTMRMISHVRSLFFALFLLLVPAASFAQVSIGISVGFPPPPLPVYEQPICPAEGYIWTPGYWAWDGDDYYWVPGTWVMAPEVGFLWTPGWWGWREDVFVFHEGYWGPVVGFYGGISYGYGYFGRGYEGGRWDHDRFYYNRSVNNINVTEIHNTYNTTIINNNTTINRVSYNGGNGGIDRRPTSEEESAARARHIPPVAAQNQHVQTARSNRELRASVNRGKPPVAATPRPGAFRDRAVVPAREAGGRYEPPANRGANAARPAIHPNDRPPHERLAPPNTGSPERDRKYQQQQEQLYSRQEQEHQKLQQRQEQEHQRLAQQNANETRRQQVEQRHQQQTQQLEQRHTQQLQHMQQKQQPPRQSESRPPHR